MHFLTVIYKFPFISWSVVPSPKGLGFLIFLPVFILPLPSPVTHVFWPVSSHSSSLPLTVFAPPSISPWLKHGQNKMLQDRGKLRSCLSAWGKGRHLRRWPLSRVQQVCGMWVVWEEALAERTAQDAQHCPTVLARKIIALITQTWNQLHKCVIFGTFFPTSGSEWFHLGDWNFVLLINKLYLQFLCLF